MKFAFGGTSTTTTSKGDRLRCWLGAVALVASLDTFALGLGDAKVLYDAGSGVTADQSPWDWIYLPDGTGISAGVSGGASFLDTMASSAARAGYSKWLSGPLDSATGFALDFSMRIGQESHANDDRSGFSVLVLDKDHRGVELSFWKDQVWTKNAGSTPFSHGESIALDTQSVERTYRLTFLGDGYTLASDGAATLHGSLRDYAAVTSPGSLAGVVYSQRSFLFFGDNTESAAARSELSMVALTPVPEPAQWAYLLAGMGMIAAVVGRRRRQRLSPI